MLLKLTVLLVALLVTAASSAAVVAPGSIKDLTEDYYNKTSSLAAWEEKAVAEASGTDRPRCLNPDPSEEYLETIQQSLVAWNSGKSAANPASRNITVDLYIHWVMRPGLGSTKDISAIRASMADQFSVLQETYKPYGIQFAPIRYDMVENDVWSQTGDDLGMKKKLRQGTYRSLNLYIVNNFPTPGGLGDCTLPISHSEMSGVNSDRYYSDGCRIKLETLPGHGGTGKVAVHEVGHWLGLYHTAQGGCSDPGDYVNDTPAQKVPSFECKVLDTCPEMAGNDPVHNFMDYTPDSCKTEFTPGQVDRMFSIWSLYRANR